MIAVLKKFFSDYVVWDDNEDERELGRELAPAALMIEMMRMDDELHENEHALLIELLQKQFKLSQEDTHELIQVASKELNKSTDYYQFTSMINQYFDYPERVSMIEQLWRMAYADRILNKNEEYLVRKISELIYVSHEDFIATKLRVRKESSA